MAGHYYALTYRTRADGCNRRLRVFLDGQVVDTVDDCVGGSTWVGRAVTFTATSASVNVKFEFRELYDGLGDVFIDNVVIGPANP